MITNSQLLKDRPFEELALAEGVSAILGLFQQHGGDYVNRIKEKYLEDMEEVRQKQLEKNQE